MELRTQRHDGILILSPVGRLDSLSCRGFEADLLPLLGDGAVSAVIDCAALDYISSAGLRVLLLAAKRCKAGQGRLVLAALRDPIRQVFEVSGFAAIFPICATTANAVTALQ